MYVVTIHEPKGRFPYDSAGQVIHAGIANSDLKTRFKIDLVYEGASSMTIDFVQSNPFFGRLTPFKTLIKVTSLATGKAVFKGRVMDVNYKMDNSGKTVASYVCEDRLAFLHDSTQEWTQVQDTTIKGLFELMVKRHNDKVEPYKQFKVGNVTVSNNTDNVYRYIDYGDTYEEIDDNLISRLGGILRVRDEVDGMYLDYLEGINEQGDEQIVLRRNLKSFKKTIDPTEIINRVYVYGKRLEEDEEEMEEDEIPEPGSVSTPRIDMASVNDGVPYLEDETLIDEFGIQEGVLTYDDITQPSYLLLRAKQFFEKQRAAKETYDVDAVNLDLINATFDNFEVGKWYTISAYPLLNIEDNLQIIEMSIDSDNPQLNKLKIGDKSTTLSNYQSNNRRLQKSVGRLEDTVGQLQNRFIDERVKNARRLAELQEEYDNAMNKSEEDMEALRKRIKELQDQLDVEPESPPGTPGLPPVFPPVFPVDYNRSGINFWTNSYGMYWGAPRDGGSRRHAGFDIGGGGSSHPIYAVQDGVVTWAGSKGGGLGIYITIKHTGDEYHTLYGHLASTSVSTGTVVKRGQQIGMMGATGGNYAIHLHIELSKTGSFHTMTNTVNPAPYLGVTSNNVTTLQNPTRI